MFLAIHLPQNEWLISLHENVNKNKAYKIPIAHGEGRYYAEIDVVEGLFEKDQVLFQYCDLNGNVSEDDNPNGSLQNIAGVSNKNKNVMGMMPHPERAVEPLLGNTAVSYTHLTLPTKA